MIVAYLAHPLSAPTREGIEQNRRNAAKWAAWLWRQGYSVECSWIVCTGELEETPENRKFGLESDCEQVRRADIMVLCGPKISGGMLLEANAASKIFDLTRLGYDLPHPGLTLDTHGQEITYSEARRRAAAYKTECRHIWDSDETGVECCALCGKRRVCKEIT